MNPGKHNLLRDLQDDAAEALRESTLMAGVRILRRKRMRRAVVQWAGVSAVVALGGFLAESTLEQRETPMTARVVVAATTTAVAAGTTGVVSATKVHYLSDDELLAMFPGTAVGLIKAGDKERLIFRIRRMKSGMWRGCEAERRLAYRGKKECCNLRGLAWFYREVR